MSLMDDIREQANEETKSHLWYSRLADEADNAGMHRTAKKLREIADDERRHSDLLWTMYESPELELGPEGPARPPPQTIAEWADLGDEIKRRDSELSHIVNDKMSSIYYNIGDVDGAKKWLVEKAKELGISIGRW